VNIPTKKYIYEFNWDIDIPSDYELIYQFHDKHDFQGKGKRYSIFAAEKIEASSLITLQENTKKFQIYNGISNDLNDNEIEIFVQAITSSLDIPKNREPKFEENYLWQKLIRYGGTLVILYFPDINQVFFIEKLV